MLCIVAITQAAVVLKQSNAYDMFNKGGSNDARIGVANNENAVHEMFPFVRQYAAKKPGERQTTSVAPAISSTYAAVRVAPMYATKKPCGSKTITTISMPTTTAEQTTTSTRKPLNMLF